MSKKRNKRSTTVTTIHLDDDGSVLVDDGYRVRWQKPIRVGVWLDAGFYSSDELNNLAYRLQTSDLSSRKGEYECDCRGPCVNTEHEIVIR